MNDLFMSYFYRINDLFPRPPYNKSTPNTLTQHCFDICVKIAGMPVLPMKPASLLVVLVSLPLVLLAVGCGKKPVHITQLDFRENIVYLGKSEKPLTGSAFAFYKNGQKMQERTFNGGKPTGIHMWHTNGRKGAAIIIREVENPSGKYWNSKGEPVDSLEASGLLDSLKYMESL